MLPVLCFNKLPLIIINMIIGSCIHFTQQQPLLQNFNNFNPSKQFRSSHQQFSRRQIIHESKLNNQKWLNPGQDLVFATTTIVPYNNGVVFVNNQPAVPTMVPFIPAATTSTPKFLDCISRCPTTSEFNPICASNREQYGNEQKFNCARKCGADFMSYSIEPDYIQRNQLSYGVLLKTQLNINHKTKYGNL